MSRAERRAKARAQAKRRQELERRQRERTLLLPPRVSRIISLTLVVVLVLGIGGWGVYSYLAGRTAAAKVLKVVNGQNITQGELTRRENVTRFLYGLAEIGPETRKALLDRLVDERLIVPEAEARGLTVTDEDLKDLTEQFASSLKALYGSDLKITVQRLRLRVSEADVTAYERVLILERKLYEAVTADVEVTEEDITALYQQYKETLDKQGLSLEDARDRLTEEALQTKRGETYSRFLEDLRARATIADPQ